MTKEKLIHNLEAVAKMAAASKFQRMFSNPFRYFSAILFREVSYKKQKQSKEVIAQTFFGQEMTVLLPASTDIYLTGGKSHDSEIRLVRFIIEHLNVKDTFIDVGAHYGYFSLLAAQIVGAQGKVIAFEASPTTFKVLKKNNDDNQILLFNKAVSNANTHLTFFEFPNLYSEYNTLDIAQFEKETWFQDSKPKAIEIEAIILDDYLQHNALFPKIIKIDVEGAEYKVIQGLQSHLQKESPLLVMEYLSNERGNEEHLKAEKLLKDLSYTSHIIDESGQLISITNIPAYLNQHGMESDNIVFCKN